MEELLHFIKYKLLLWLKNMQQTKIFHLSFLYMNKSKWCYYNRLVFKFFDEVKFKRIKLIKSQ